MTWTTQELVTSRDGTTIAVHTLGCGPDLVVVGGALQAAEDYRGLARLLGQAFTVHVTDRRGRGGSGPHGPHYSLDTEIEDLLAVQAATGARAAFGHSYGGLVVLEAMASGADLTTASVFEPGVSINGSIPTGWLDGYRQMLARGDTYGAFAHFIRSNPQAPAITRVLPRWYLRLALHAMPGFQDRIAPRLDGNALEHEQVADRDDQFHAYRSIRGSVQLLAGTKSPTFVATTMQTLNDTIPRSTAALLPGLGHMAPLAQRPTSLAHVITAHHQPANQA